MARDEVDVAIAWGPLAGFWAARQHPALVLQPLPAEAGTFEIALGVRKHDDALARELDAVLEREQPSHLRPARALSRAPPVSGSARNRCAGTLGAPA